MDTNKIKIPNIWETAFKEQILYKTIAPSNKKLNFRPNNLNWLFKWESNLLYQTSMDPIPNL